MNMAGVKLSALNTKLLHTSVDTVHIVYREMFHAYYINMLKYS
jgi:hypothetical protein